MAFTSVPVKLTTLLQRWLDLPGECPMLPVACMRVRVFCLADGVYTAWTHPVKVIMVICVRVHMLSWVRLLLLLIEILRAVECALATIEAHVCGWGLQQARRFFGGRNGASSQGEGRFLLLEDRWRVAVHSSELDCFLWISRAVRAVRDWRFPNSLDAEAGLSTVASPNPTRARNYRARQAEPSRAGQRGVNVSFSLAGQVAPCLCPEAKTAPTVACLTPSFSPQKPPLSLFSDLRHGA